MPQDTVTLKQHGKAFACSSKLGRKKCGGKDFTVDPLSGNGVTIYRCLRCEAPCVENGLEALLPPRNDWRTPGGNWLNPVAGGLWTTLGLEYAYNIDLAADAANRKLALHYDGLTPETDALKVPRWGMHPSLAGALRPENTRGWGQPPYQPKGTIADWLTKAVEQASLGVFSTWLIPMSSSVAWFNELVVPYAEWQTWNGRIAFEDPLATEDDERTSPKQDNLFVIYDPHSDVIGHTAHRCSKTGRRLWTRPDVRNRVDAKFLEAA